MSDIIPLDQVEDDTVPQAAMRNIISLDQVEDDSPANNQPTWKQASYQVAKDLGEGVFTGIPSALGLVNDVGSGLMRKVGQVAGIEDTSKPAFNLDTTKKFGEQGRSLWNKLAGNPEDVVEPNTVARYSKAALQGASFPGGVIPNTIASLGAQAGADVAPEHPILGSIAGSLLALKAPGAIKSVANKAGQTLTNAGKAFERASVGAGVKDYLRSKKVSGLMEDAQTGEASTKLKQSINEIGEKDGWGLNRSPEKLLERNAQALENYGAQIDEMLTAADVKGVKPKFIVSFKGSDSSTAKLIQSAKADKAELMAVRDDFLKRLYDKNNGWNGTVSDLNKWKSALDDIAYSSTAQGGLRPAREAAIKRALAGDMRKAVKESIEKAGVASKKEIEDAFHNYAIRADVHPVLAEAVTKGEASTSASLLRGLLRTSGGTLTTPTMIGAATGGTMGGPVGLMLGAGLGALGSPTGAGIAGSTLKKAGSLFKKGTSIFNKLPSGGVKNIPATTSIMTRPQKQEVDNIMSDSNQDNPQETLLGIPADPLLDAVRQVESGGNPNAVSPAGAQGAYQFMPSMAKAFGIDPFNEEQSRTAAAELLRQEYEALKSPELALAAYNAGRPAVLRAISRAKSNDWQQVAQYLPEETRNYVPKILSKLG